MIATGQAVDDAQRVPDHFGSAVNQPRRGKSGTEMSQQRGIDPAAIDQIEACCDTQAAGQLDAMEYCFA